MVFILNKKVKNNKKIAVVKSAGENIVTSEETLFATLCTCCSPIIVKSLGTEIRGCCFPCSREIRDKLFCKDGGPLERRGSSLTSDFCLGVQIICYYKQHEHE